MNERRALKLDVRAIDCGDDPCAVGLGRATYVGDDDCLASYLAGREIGPNRQPDNAASSGRRSRYGNRNPEAIGHLVARARGGIGQGAGRKYLNRTDS